LRADDASPAGPWCGRVALALQPADAGHLNAASLNTPSARDTAFILTGPLAPGAQDLSPGPQSHGNALTFAMIGKELPASGLSIGGSISWGKLRAIDGVDLPYPGSA